jgi:hypothetical protein
MRRIIMAAAVSAVGLLGLPTPANADYVDGMCTPTFLSTGVHVENPDLRGHVDFVITAHPASPDPTKTFTTTRCLLYKGTLDLPAYAWETTVPGPTGALAATIDLVTEPEGTTWFLCTEVTTEPRSEVVVYCDVGFWW